MRHKACSTEGNLPSSLKCRHTNGAKRESSPCQYTKVGLARIQLFNTRLSLPWPSGEDSSRSYWWHLGISTWCSAAK